MPPLRLSFNLTTPAQPPRDARAPFSRGAGDGTTKHVSHRSTPNMPGTDIQEVLAGLKSAQQKPLDMLTKSTFTESMSQTSGLTFYDLELGAKFVYPVLTPPAQRDPAGQRPGRSRRQLAVDHRDQHAGAALRRLRRQPRRRARRGDAGLFGRLQGHRRRDLGRFRGAICRPGVRRCPRRRRQDGSRIADAGRGGDDPRRLRVAAARHHSHSHPQRCRYRRLAGRQSRAERHLRRADP